MPSRRRKNAPADALDEHAAILRTAEVLEETLAALQATRPRVWRRRLLRGCTPLSTSLRDHCEFSERPGGTLADLEIAIGRLVELTAARREHMQLMAHAAELFVAIDRAGDGAQLPPAVSAWSAQFVAAIRGHCQSELGLIQLRYNLDVGVVD